MQYDIERKLFDENLKISFTSIITGKLITFEVTDKNNAYKQVYTHQTSEILSYLYGLTEQRKKAHETYITTSKIASFNLIDTLLKENSKFFDVKATIKIIEILEPLTKNKTSLTRLNKISNWLNNEIK